MKRIITLIIMMAIMLPVSVYAGYENCQGCCSSHGGVVCENGITRCGDGTPLSATCSAKGCNACVNYDGDNYIIELLYAEMTDMSSE